MKRYLLLSYLLCAAYSIAFSQNVGIGTATPDGSAQLDIASAAKGLLIPRMTTASINAIINPARGLMVYDSLTNRLMVNTGAPGESAWQTIAGNNAWNLNGNYSVNPVTEFIGNNDSRPLRFRVNGIPAGELNPVTGNISWGLRAGIASYSNVAIGTDALRSNSNRPNLVAIGDSALFNNGTGSVVTALHSTANTATGSKSLFSNTVGFNNTANGYRALYSNTNGVRNTAMGASALYSNATGVNNTAVGSSALYSNINGVHNAAFGQEVMYLNTTGVYNTALGSASMYSNTTGNYNAASGTWALSGNTTGSANTGIGYLALNSVSTSYYNTALGYQAGSNFNHGWNNTFIGSGSNALAAGLYNSIALGTDASATASNQARIGNSSTTSIGGYQNWTSISDGRYKKNIKEDVKGLEFILKLHPVTYQLDVSILSKQLNEQRTESWNEDMKKAMLEKEKMIQSGFIAQEVEQVAKQTGYDFSGVDKPKNSNDFYGLRYAEFVVPLVKAVQELSALVNDLQKRLLLQEEQNKLLKRANKK